HKISVSVLLNFLSSSASGGDPYLTATGASEAGMNYSCIMKAGFWSSFHNQALLCDYQSLSIGVNYENRFNISELGTRTAGAIIPAGKTTLGIQYSNFGYKDFMRQSAGIACAMKLSGKISAGIQIDYLGERSSGEYGGSKALTFEAGVILIPAERIRIGLHLFNPVPGSIRKRYLPSAIRAGAGINLSEGLFAGAELQICTGRKLVARTGFEYEVAKKFRIRGGFSSENTSFSFGLGYNLKSVCIDLGFLSHENLGITTSASLIFKIN
ncbi:MAG: hypothetical protein WAL29_10915, partial [Bacteroidales bacterium]